MEKPIIFVLGKPGCGKGTVCSKLMHSIKVKHMSAGELLREEVQTNPDSEEGKLIERQMKEGTIVDPKITIKLLKRTMEQNQQYKGFLIDGFPRQMNNYDEFVKQIDENRCYLLHLKCSDETCKERIHGRGSGRIDDNDETIQHRLDNFQQETMKVINLFSQKLRLFEVSAENDQATVVRDAELSIIHLLHRE